jgi:hypothetical protein
LLRPLRQFLRLDRQRQRLFLEAWRALGSTRLALRSTPFKQLVGGLTLHRGPVETTAVGPEALEQARRIGWAVRAATGYTPWRSSCLVQVLAAQRMLQQRLLPGAIYIGASLEEGPGEGARSATDSGLEAHAWLKCGELFITGESGHERYAVVSTFSWV